MDIHEQETYSREKRISRNIRVPNIKSESGKKVADVLRNQLYNK